MKCSYSMIKKSRAVVLSFLTMGTHGAPGPTNSDYGPGSRAVGPLHLMTKEWFVLFLVS